MQFYDIDTESESETNNYFVQEEVQDQSDTEDEEEYMKELDDDRTNENLEEENKDLEK